MTSFRSFLVTLLFVFTTMSHQLFADISYANMNPHGSNLAYNISYVNQDSPYRLLNSFDPAGATVELDDQSIWRVEGGESRDNVLSWRVNDPLVIYPVTWTLFTGTRFFIYNERTRNSANAEISLGPVIGGPCNNRIIYIDYSYGEVRLQDGRGNVSIWHVDYKDLYQIQTWQPYQSVILGSNDTWPANWGSNCNYILLNIEANDYIRADLY